MGDLIELTPPTSVEFDGQARHVIGTLAKVAVDLGRLLGNAPPDIRKTLEKSIATLESVVRMMTAIDDTINTIEYNSENLLRIVNDGMEADFVNGLTSVTIIVNGTLERRSNCLRIQELGLHELVQIEKLSEMQNGFRILRLR